MATGDPHNKFREGLSSSRDMQTDTHTDRRTDRQINHNTLLPYQRRAIMHIILNTYLQAMMAMP